MPCGASLARGWTASSSETASSRSRPEAGDVVPGSAALVVGKDLPVAGPGARAVPDRLPAPRATGEVLRPDDGRARLRGLARGPPGREAAGHGYGRLRD